MSLRAGRSLALHLLAWTLGALTLVWAVFVLVGYRTGAHEADELTDGHLASVSSLLLPLAAQGLPWQPAPAQSGGRGEMRSHDYQRSISVVVWDAQGRMLSRSGAAPVPPFGAPDGFATLELGSPSQPWRAFSRWDPQHAHKLMVLLSEAERDDLAEDIAQQVTEPGLWLLPVVALALGLAIHRGMRPLRRLAEEVNALEPQQARKLLAPAPFQEMEAAIAAINLLVDRYHAALDRERALADEFAHELRTPLTSLALQARGVRDAPSDAARRAALERLEQDALRAGQVLQHLLTLARASRAALDEAAQPFDLEQLAAAVVAEFAPHAHAGGRELGLASSGPFPLSGHPVLMELALRNLVQNALAHTPAGTQVEVQLDAGQHFLQVSDDGPQRGPAAGGALPPALQPLGLGLGHRVVEKVAALHGASFEPGLSLPGPRRAARLRFGAAQA